MDVLAGLIGQISSVAVDHLALTLLLVLGTFLYFALPAYEANRNKQLQQNKVNNRPRMDSPFGLGFANCKEVEGTIELEVQGTLPSWLNGVLYRNGPGTLSVDTKKGYTFHTTHWFDGLTMMHKFVIEDGKVLYANKKAAREVENYIAKYGGTLMSFGPDPCKSVFDKVSSLFSPMRAKDPQTGRDAANIGVSVKRIQGQLHNTTDASILMEFDGDTLQTTGRVKQYENFDPKLKGQLSATHGQYDAKRKEFVNFVCALGAKATYTIFALPDDSKEAKVISTITVPKASYIHSFAMTENYFILEVWPLFINPLKMLWNKSVVESMAWNAQEPTKFYVVNRNSGNLEHVYEHPSFFCFHNINAFEDRDNDSIVVDLTSYKDDGLIKDLLLDNMLSADPHYDIGEVVRFTLGNVTNKDPAVKKDIKKQVVYNNTLELQRINPHWHMKPYQYCYGLSVSEMDQAIFSTITKLNVETGEHQSWKKANCFPAEAIFVPDPQGTKEDDGLLLSIVLDGQNRNSFLLVLDARDLSEVARATVPLTIPFGFHGNFFGEGKSSSDVA